MLSNQVIWHCWRLDSLSIRINTQFHWFSLCAMRTNIEQYCLWRVNRPFSVSSFLSLSVLIWTINLNDDTNENCHLIYSHDFFVISVAFPFHVANLLIFAQFIFAVVTYFFLLKFTRIHCVIHKVPFIFLSVVSLLRVVAEICGVDAVKLIMFIWFWWAFLPSWNYGTQTLLNACV